jgi:predicted metalloprotease
MRLDDERESSNVQDVRGRRGIPGGGGMRIGGIGALVLVAGALLFGVDPRIVLGLLEGGPAPQQQVTQNPGPAGRNDPQRQFVSRILASTEDVWTEQFRAMGRRYQDPQLVLFSGATQSGCGVAQTAVGPFYCPNDQKVYLDLDFFQELQNRMGAGGEFARAYVIAHEIGHHVQNQLGTLSKVDQVRPQLSQVDQNQLSVRVELQADCFAGVWANHAEREKRILEQGDIESGLNAAAAVGDDRLQRAARGTVSPDSFTHGSSAQRVSWFRRGLQTGDINQCNTFTAQ